MTRSLIIALLLVFLIGCSSVVVNQRDDATIRNFNQLKEIYLQDLATSLSTEDDGEVVEPGDLGEETEFPGDLTWDEVDSTLGIFDAAIAYEEAKKNPGDEDEEETEEAPIEE